jgi:hypothetical protein
MKHPFTALLGITCLGLGVLAPMGVRPADGACCYFSAKDKDVNQPAQKAFITWDAKENVESFTVQPKFEGNAQDFGMVIPTPAKPRLDEMPRDFFKELAVFTILEPMDLSKYKQMRYLFAAQAGGARRDQAVRKTTVKVLEAGIVGSLDYKIVAAERADDLYQWLKDNQYQYAGDEQTLGFYIDKHWFFTVMKIDAKQMKPRPDGTYEGDVTPTRFQFTSERCIYPLRITRISVKDKTEALFYVQSADKVDLPERFSYEPAFVPMWSQATGYAIPEKLTAQEKEWEQHVKGRIPQLTERAAADRQKAHEPATLEWAKRLTDRDLAVLSGEQKYNRDAPPADVEKLKLLKGHLKQGQFVTKLRKVFAKDEMGEDLEFVRARVGDRHDDIEYYAVLPTSPP